MKDIKTKENCVDVKKKVRGKTLALEAAMLSSRKMREAAGDVMKDSEDPSSGSFFESESVENAAKNIARTGETVTAKGGRASVKTANRLLSYGKDQISVKRAERTAAREAAKTRARSQAMAKAAKEGTERTEAAVKNVGKAAADAGKAIVSAVENLIAKIAASGSVAVIILIVCAVIIVIGAAFAIFSDQSDDDARKTCDVIREINLEYQNELDRYFGMEYDEREVSGSRTEWADVLAVYAALLAEDENADASVMTEKNERLLRKVFWDMNTIEGQIEQESDENADTETKTLYVTASHKTVEEMVEEYDFSEEQKDILQMIRAEEYADEWDNVIYGNRSTEERLIAVALSQVGDVCGSKYWNFCGYNTRIPWCACFVTWCADQSGILGELGLPRYINVADWVNWSKRNGRWYDGSITPEPGMMIFYDWYEEAPDDSDGDMVQDGVSEHIGIVIKVENGKVYTVEGNVNDSCMACERPLRGEEIMGYGKLSLKLN